MSVNIVNVDIGKQYWFLEIDPESVALFRYEYTSDTILFSEQDYNVLSLCELREVSERVKYPFVNSNIDPEIAEKYKSWLNKTCYFYDENNSCHDRDWVCLFGHVFESVDDYIVHLVKTKLKIESRPQFYLNSTKIVKIEFDNFIQTKIKESQDKNPHKWIF